MTVLVVRQSLDGHTIGGPRLCARPGRIARVPGLLTLEELFAIFLTEGESVQEDDELGRWKILRANQHTGYFQVLDQK
jgi:hypothetical protein